MDTGQHIAQTSAKEYSTSGMDFVPRRLYLEIVQHGQCCEVALEFATKNPDDADMGCSVAASAETGALNLFKLFIAKVSFFRSGPTLTRTSALCERRRLHRRNRLARKILTRTADNGMFNASAIWE
jgi:hypothetical protein